MFVQGYRVIMIILLFHAQWERKTGIDNKHWKSSRVKQELQIAKKDFACRKVRKLSNSTVGKNKQKKLERLLLTGRIEQMK